MATKKPNGSKRQSPSRERLLALTLVRLIECLGPMDDLRSVIQAEATGEGTKIFAALETATDEARQLLAVSGYDKLESIATRVARIEAELSSAIAEKDGAKIAVLGAALDRAKSGKPPLTVVEKKAKTSTPEPRKPKVSKAVKTIVDAFPETNFVDAEGHAVTGIKPDETGKQCMVQFDNGNDWVSIDPKDLKGNYILDCPARI